SFLIVTSHFNSEVYRSKGKPKISLFSQLITLVFLIPKCLISVKYGFLTLVYARSLIRFQGVINCYKIIKLIIYFFIIQTLNNLTIENVVTSLMILISFLLMQVFNTVLWSLISILICIVVYLSLFMIFAKEDSMFLIRILKNRT